MEIFLDVDKLEGEYNFYSDNLGQYITKLIDLYSATSVSHSKWLTPREKEFFVAMIIIHNSGISDHKSSSAREIYDKVFGKQKKSVIGDYIRRLEDKDWIRVVGGDVEITPFFDDISLDNHLSTFKISYSLVDDNR